VVWYVLAQHHGLALVVRVCIGPFKEQKICAELLIHVSIKLSHENFTLITHLSDSAELNVSIDCALQ
jgi:hypothetical protein